ncbi:MAG: GNAT family N-acetyltransferase [Deltaproteobacteria bacterium]|nr:GNAT family N-acetyltransferase [Deltaproteobacteria bacterium]
MAEFNIRKANWDSDQSTIVSVRETVFIKEQGVYRAEEFDGLDPECIQLLAEDLDQNAIGTARLTRAGKIGRMAVLPAWRGRGVGAALLGALLETARELGIAQVILDAQVKAIGFYETRGFVAKGPEFMDARIPHRKMYLDL